MTETVTIPRDVVERALWKAKIEYDRGQVYVAEDENWAEFERLAEYLEV